MLADVLALVDALVLAEILALDEALVLAIIELLILSDSDVKFLLLVASIIFSYELL